MSQEVLAEKMFQDSPLFSRSDKDIEEMNLICYNYIVVLWTQKNFAKKRDGFMQQMNMFSMIDMIGQDKSFSAICDSLGCENNSPAWPDKFGAAIKKWLEDNNVPEIKTLSLFSGAGGLDIGFSDVGFDIVSSVEIERKFCDTLELNTGKGKRFNNSKVHCIDIRALSGEDIGDIDFIIGGPPCQTFSAAGRRANGVPGTTDARGMLFKEYVRLLKELSPKGFLFENVYGIVGAQNGEAWREILEAFSKAGYKLVYRIVDAADYGAPQHRERLLIVGLKEGVFKFPRPTHGPDSLDKEPFYNAETAIEGVVSKESEESNKLGGRYAGLLSDIPPGLNYSFYTEEMGHPNPVFAWRSKFSDFLYKADPNAPVRTIKASGGAYTGPLHWENRFFNYEEYKRLQTIPDDYEISGSKQIAVKQIGNSVPPQLARMMAIAIRAEVFDTKFPFELSFLQEGEELTFRKRKRALTSVYRKKAEMAIKALKQESGALPDSRKYGCTIDSSFHFKEASRTDAQFMVNVNWAEELEIEVTAINEVRDTPSASITIVPRGNQWPLKVKSVILTVKADILPGLTVAWKAFEQELIVNGMKADLVQLNGYYQYRPKLLVTAVVSDNVKYAEVLRWVMRNREIPEIKKTHTLAQEWNVLDSDVMDAAEYLRILGYEIRNHSTNPQIDADHWLIPYVFPTLTPQSVQLRKKLR